MFSIESNVKNDEHFFLQGERERNSCVLINIHSTLNQKEIKYIYSLCQILVRHEIVVLNIDPSISKDIVSIFEEDNIHILRLESNKLYDKNKAPFFLLHHDDLAYLDTKKNDLSHKILLDLYIPKIDEDISCDVFFKYSLINNTALITTNDKKNIPEINKLFLNKLHVEQIIYLFSNENNFVGRFIDEKNILFSQDKKDPNYNNNINKLSPYYNIINLPYINNSNSYLNYYLDNEILIMPSISTSKDKIVKDILDSNKINNTFIKTKELSKLNTNLYDFIINIPYSDKYKFLDK